MKKVLLFLLILMSLAVFLVGCGCQDLPPEGDYQVGDLYYNLTEDKSGYEVVGICNGGDFLPEMEVVIPDTYNGLPVLGIRGFDTKDAPSITKITLPQYLVYISEGGLSYLTQVEEITLPNSLKEIGEGAFYGCASLTGIDIPPQVTVIEENTFTNCFSLERVGLHSNLTQIKAQAFSNSGITSVSVPDSVTELGEHVFFSCVSLKTAKLPAGLTEIPDCLFSGCTQLESISHESDFTKIGDGAFRGCTRLNGINVSKATSIGDQAFAGCDSLMSKYSGIYYVGGWIVGCDDDELEENLAINNGVIGVAKGVFAGTSLKSVIIADTVLHLGSSAFEGIEALERVEIGAGVLSIGEKCFLNCKMLSEILVSSDNTAYTVNNNALYTKDGKVLLQYFTGFMASGEYIVADGTEEIGKYAFVSSNLEKITVCEGVKLINIGAFSNCEALKEISLPTSLKEIEGSAFNSCSALLELTLPEGLVKISQSMLSNNISLKRITLPSTLEEIEAHAFDGCTALEAVTLPESVQKIREKSFKDCLSLSAIHITQNVSSIADDAFENCQITITVDSRNTSYKIENGKLVQITDNDEAVE